MALFSQLPTMPKLVMFDLDGTLVDSVADIALALNRALAELGFPAVSLAQVRDWVGRGASRLVYCVLEHVRVTADQHDRVLATFMRHYQQSVCEESTLYPGVIELLEAARAAHIALACVTNKPFAPAQALLDELALSPYFDLVLGGDSLPHKKPHPAPLQHCLQYFSVSAAQALMVGDSRNDVEAAKAAGVAVVAVPYGYNHGEPIIASKPTYLVESLRELL